MRTSTLDVENWQHHSSVEQLLDSQNTIRQRLASIHGAKSSLIDGQWAVCRLLGSYRFVTEWPVTRPERKFGSMSALAILHQPPF